MTPSQRIWIIASGLILTLATAMLPQSALGAHGRRVGADVSYPQCTRSLPTSYDFLIVGVNGGVATSSNPCIQNELIWAADSSTVQSLHLTFYANTGNPADVIPPVADWPSTSNPLIDPYGVCRHSNSPACAWQFGYNRAQVDTATVTSQFWWLDIETANSWSQNLQTNRADLQGMVYGFTIAGAGVGVYSLPNWWRQIVGTIPKRNSLFGLPEWLPGASDQNQAIANCADPTFTGSPRVAMTQFTSADHDYDVTCL